VLPAVSCGGRALDSGTRNCRPQGIFVIAIIYIDNDSYSHQYRFQIISYERCLSRKPFTRFFNLQVRFSVKSQTRNLFDAVVMIILGVTLLSAFWEFYLEDLLVPHIYTYYHPEPLYERVEYIITTLVFIVIALIMPTRLAYKSIRDADQARASLSQAYNELEKRVQERTQELVHANEQLKEEIRQRQQSEEALHKSEKAQRLLSSQLLTAQENERRRIAQDIHDNVSQTLVAMKFRIENALKDFDAYRDRDDLSNMLVPVIQDAIDEVRDIYMRLRPSILDDLGLLATLSWLWRDFQAANPDIEIKSDLDIEDSDLPEKLKVVIFRVVQEALDNIARHSEAGHVDVSLRRQGGNVDLTVQDDGIGLNLEEVLTVDDSLRGMGLSGMLERTELLGGTLRIEGEKGKGTRILASWPVRGSDEA